MSTSKSNVSASADLLARREHLIAELEKAAKTAQGTLQQVLQKMAVLIGGTRPGSTISAEGCQEINDAFLRFSTDPDAPLTPPILMQAMEWVQAFLMATSSSMSRPAAAGARASSASGVPATLRGGKGNDGFDSGSAQKARALTGEVPLSPPAKPDVAKEQQQQLESFKAWMKNPALGKVKG